MKSSRNISVFNRFFEAVDVLREMNRSYIPEFCDKMGADRGNFYRKRRGERGADKIPVEWLSVIVEEYNVSAEWLLIGRGKMFASKKEA